MFLVHHGSMRRYEGYATYRHASIRPAMDGRRVVCGYCKALIEQLLNHRRLEAVLRTLIAVASLAPKSGKC